MSSTTCRWLYCISFFFLLSQVIARFGFPVNGFFYSVIYTIMSYTDYLHREEWLARRKEIIYRDNSKCQASGCKTPESHLEVHHLDYLSYDLAPWEYPNDMLITICNICHGKEQFRYIHEDNLLTALKFKGFLVSDLVAFTTYLHTKKNFANEILNNLRKLQNG